jgi:hypothetical protein
MFVLVLILILFYESFSLSIVQGSYDISSDFHINYVLYGENQTVWFKLSSMKSTWIGFGIGGISAGMIGADVIIGLNSGIIQRY